MRNVLHSLLIASIILVYGGGSVVAVEVEHSHEHAHSIENAEDQHGHHHHAPVDSSNEGHDDKDGGDEENSHSSSHSHVVSMDLGALMTGPGHICPVFQRWISPRPVSFDEGCPDGPCFSLMKPPQ